MTEWTLSRVSVSPVSCEILRGVIFRIRKQQHLDITGQSCRNQKTLQTNLTTVVCAETRDLKSFFSLSFSLLLLFLLSSHLSPPLPSSSTCPPFPFTPLLLLASVTLIFLYSCPKLTSPFQADFWSSFCLVSGLLFILFSVVPLLFLLQKQKRKKKKAKEATLFMPFLFIFLHSPPLSAGSNATAALSFSSSPTSSSSTPPAYTDLSNWENFLFPSWVFRSSARLFTKQSAALASSEIAI